MKYLGIDYGTKRVGVAASDSDGRIAFPKGVLQNDSELLNKLILLCKEEAVEALVFGESRDFSGAPNPVMQKKKEFGEKIKKEIGLPIFYEQEFLTSHEASQKINFLHVASDVRDDGRAGRSPSKKEPVDASAAAIILQSYLDKNNN